MRDTPKFAVAWALAAAMPVPGVADESAIGFGARLAMSLEEMNCASSEVQARAAVPAVDQAADPDRIRLADSSSGTNGIPRPPRDPKTPPRQRS